MNKEFVLSKNKHLYVTPMKDTIVYHVTIKKRKEIWVQFFVCLHMLFKGRPMTNYKNMNKSLDFLDVKNIRKTK
jgi:hypothetical protein